MTELFQKYGEDAGLVSAPEGRVPVKLCLSPERISLHDPHNSLFLVRNYPQHTLLGVACHPTDSQCFAFASLPVAPMMNAVMKVKCHMFRSEKCSEIARKYVSLYGAATGEIISGL